MEVLAPSPHPREGQDKVGKGGREGEEGRGFSMVTLSTRCCPSFPLASLPAPLSPRLSPLARPR